MALKDPISNGQKPISQAIAGPSPVPPVGGELENVGSSVVIDIKGGPVYLLVRYLRGK